MTSWTETQNGIKAAIVYVAQVAAGAVAWSDEQRPSAKTLIILDLLYVDAIQDREDVVTATLAWTLSTLYYIRVQVRAESVFNGPGVDALFALERVRAGLHRPDIVLSADLGIQFDDQTYVHHVSTTADGRTISSYSFELGFRAVLDYPLAGGAVMADPNMVEVDVHTGTVDLGSGTPPQIDRVVLRPT